MVVLEFVGAFCLDLILGDPRRLPHPVRWIGRGIARVEAVLRRVTSGAPAEKAAGVALLGIVVITTYLLSFLALEAAGSLSLIFVSVLTVYLGFTALATRTLADEALAIYRALEAGDMAKARTRLSFIVGRDTLNLDEEEIVRATVETVAENASDGVGAPLFYLALGGVPLALSYKAVNTLDSMVGYKNERYRNLGWASARFDDAVNYLPARVTALALVAAAFVLGKSPGNAWRMVRRDGRNHPSPNSGYPEAAVAGALGVRLGGLNHYQGAPSLKPFIGEPVKGMTRDTIREAVALLYGASLLMFLCAVAVMVICGRAVV